MMVFTSHGAFSFTLTILRGGELPIYQTLEGKMGWLADLCQMSDMNPQPHNLASELHALSNSIDKMDIIN